MSCDTFLPGDSVIRRLDPRIRILAALAFSILIAFAARLPVLTAGLAVAVLTAFAADLPAAPTLRRLAGLNIFMLLLFLLLPLSTAGNPLLTLGPLTWTDTGTRMAASITLKANAIVLCYTALLSTVEPVRLGHALHRLRAPEKLVHLYMFTVRYIDVIHHEYDRMTTAMKVRCFRPRLNLHTLRTFGHMVGMLLVNSLDRSERIVAAMKCRGFRGRFHVLDGATARGREVLFSFLSLAVILALGWAEWA